MKKVFVSGCYDLLHAGHLQFFQEAKALAEHLTLCFASDRVLWEHKKRRSSIPQDHKFALLNGLAIIDQVVIGDCQELGLDFKDHFLRIRPDFLAVTEDDRYRDLKVALCREVGAQYVVLPKTPPLFTPVSTSSLIEGIRTPAEAPLRVDFGGGWLDVPKYAKAGAFIVNCAISPTVSLHDWPYKQKSGLGGSGAWALLNGKDGVESELQLGVGWQDPAIIRETGLCVWRSGERPILHLKRNGDFLQGRMALHDTKIPHDTPGNTKNPRDYAQIEQAGRTAAEGVEKMDLSLLGKAIDLSYQAQLGEGMAELPSASGCLARKYCGGGWGGYALYLFDSSAARDAFVASSSDNRAIEPFLKNR